MSSNKFLDTIIETQNPHKSELNPKLNPGEKKHIPWKTIAMVTAISIVIVLIAIMFPRLAKKIGILIEPQSKVITETIVIPDTKKIATTDARVPSGGGYAVPLVPKTGEEHIAVANAVLTLKGSYDITVKERATWATDAKLVYIKSLGAVTIEGKSSTWQIAMGSKTKKKGYEIIVQGDKIISQKEVESNVYGFDLPNNWYDSHDAVISLQTLPQFSDATISSLSFFYNTDGKRWGYAFATSRGTTSMPVK